MKKLLAILCAAVLACALALPALAADDAVLIATDALDARAADDIILVNTDNPDEVIEVSLFARSGEPAAQDIMPISVIMPVKEEAKDLSCCEAAKLLWNGYRAGKFTFFDIVRAPFDILF